MHLWAAVRTDEGRALASGVDGCLEKSFATAAAAAIPMIPSTFAIADGGRGPWPPFCEEEEEEDEDDDGDQGEKHFSTESEKEEGNRAICCR